jgi:hypothetical protein
MTSEVTVDSLLADFAAPATFDITIPNGVVLKCRGFASYGEKKKFERERKEFITTQIKAKEAAIKEADNDLIAPPYRPYAHLLTEDNLEAAYTMHRICIEPVFSPIDALRLCEAPQLVTYFIDQASWHAANYLVTLKNQLYGAAKKELQPTPSED